MSAHASAEAARTWRRSYGNQEVSGYDGLIPSPRPAVIDRALRDARAWCAGHTIDDRPALVHAIRVAVTIGDHVPAPPHEVIAAALLHDAPDLAPPALDV